jgi:hypothetical protein
MSDRLKALASIQAHLRRQIAEADAILADIHEFNRDNPDEKPISGDDCPWLLDVDKHRREFKAMLETVSQLIANED